MAYGRNTFLDPRTGHSYTWQINHTEEEEGGVDRPTEVLGRTDGGYIVQQGAGGPLRLRMTGTILHQHQFDEFKNFVALCRTQTIHFTDFAGDSYEVVVTSWKPVRKRTLRNPRDSAIRLHYWTYTMELQVVRVIAGTWLGAA